MSDTITLADLLQHATPYERWRAPIRPALRRGVWVSLVSITALVGVAWSSNLLLQVLEFPFWIVLPKQVETTIRWLDLHHVAISGLALEYLACVGAVGIRTRGFRVGRPFWQMATLALNIPGYLAGGSLAIFLGMISVNVLLWLLLAALIGGCIVLMLRLYLYRNRRSGEVDRNSMYWREKKTEN